MAFRDRPGHMMKPGLVFADPVPLAVVDGEGVVGVVALVITTDCVWPGVAMVDVVELNCVLLAVVLTEIVVSFEAVVEFKILIMVVPF